MVVQRRVDRLGERAIQIGGRAVAGEGEWQRSRDADADEHHAQRDEVRSYPDEPRLPFDDHRSTIGHPRTDTIGPGHTQPGAEPTARASAIATLTIADRHLRAAHGIPQLDRDQRLTEYRNAMGETGFREATQSGAGMSPADAVAYARTLTVPVGSPLDALTNRQRAIAELVATGMTNR